MHNPAAVPVTWCEPFECVEDQNPPGSQGRPTPTSLLPVITKRLRALKGPMRACAEGVFVGCTSGPVNDETVCMGFGGCAALWMLRCRSKTLRHSRAETRSCARSFLAACCRPVCGDPDPVLSQRSLSGAFEGGTGEAPGRLEEQAEPLTPLQALVARPIDIVTPRLSALHPTQLFRCPACLLMTARAHLELWSD